MITAVYVGSEIVSACETIGDTKEEALEQLAKAWRSWLAFMDLRQAESSRAAIP